ncbi:diphthine--ammonia ligase [Polynucleobacter sp. 15G-AUS-farblos]|uniref:Dph6-related ATP pyrophosphatase n=1 Tax=Polynucleobacter sp. 15G-AUS-farblos TaxID=2689094 RepID=UPI001C0C87CF|nr:diphthine--ammonia ligase [Polynucleobacter sp. 15G-AUS-farblos]MBU3583488.1 diphthine--ammonia ligase [Polynucleobacter sp. 15G-AUS-farblos]
MTLNKINSGASWSGGKDSCLALWRSQKAGFTVTHLLTALDETSLKTRSHGVTRDLILAQGRSLGMVNEFISASWQDYETQFIEKLKFLASQGISQMIFGDIDLLAHRKWEEMVCARAGITANLPLWNENRLDIVHQFLDVGFKAKVVCVDGRYLNDSYVGREFNNEFISSLPMGVDACGENGEFHTFVYDGPNFKHPVAWKSLGKKSYVSPKEYGSQTFYFDLLDAG